MNNPEPVNACQDTPSLDVTCGPELGVLADVLHSRGWSLDEARLIREEGPGNPALCARAWDEAPPDDHVTRALLLRIGYVPTLRLEMAGSWVEIRFAPKEAAWGPRPTLRELQEAAQAIQRGMDAIRALWTEASPGIVRALSRLFQVHVDGRHLDRRGLLPPDVLQAEIKAQLDALGEELRVRAGEIPDPPPIQLPAPVDVAELQAELEQRTWEGDPEPPRRTRPPAGREWWRRNDR